MFRGCVDKREGEDRSEKERTRRCYRVERVDGTGRGREKKEDAARSSKSLDWTIGRR